MGLWHILHGSLHRQSEFLLTILSKIWLDWFRLLRMLCHILVNFIRITVRNTAMQNVLRRLGKACCVWSYTLPLFRKERFDGALKFKLSLFLSLQALQFLDLVLDLAFIQKRLCCFSVVIDAIYWSYHSFDEGVCFSLLLLHHFGLLKQNLR